MHPLKFTAMYSDWEMAATHDVTIYRGEMSFYRDKQIICGLNKYWVFTYHGVFGRTRTIYMLHLVMADSRYLILGS